MQRDLSDLGPPPIYAVDTYFKEEVGGVGGRPTGCSAGSPGSLLRKRMLVRWHREGMRLATDQKYHFKSRQMGWAEVWLLSPKRIRNL